MKNPQLLIFGLAGTLFTSHAAHSATIVALEDNYVLNSASNTVQDFDGNLIVKRASNNIRKSWIKFDLTGQNADLSQSGTVTLTLANNSSTSTTFRIALYALDDTGATAPTWTESTITWNNAPGNDTGGSGINDLESDETSLIGESSTISSNTAAGTQYQFTIPMLSTYMQSDNTITAIAISSFQPDPGPSLAIASSENGTEAWRPTLTFTQVPEPSTYALFAGLVSIGCIAMHRRRKQQK